MEKMTADDMRIIDEALRKHAIATASPAELFAGEKGEAARKYALATASINEFLEGIGTEKTLAKIEIEERLAGMSVESIRALLKQIKYVLSMQEPTTQIASDQGSHKLFRSDQSEEDILWQQAEETHARRQRDLKSIVTVSASEFLADS